VSESFLEEEVAALRREIRALRTGRLTARLTEAEKDDLAARVAERLEPMLQSLQRREREIPPKRPKKRKRGLFRDDD
jgi:hypothetical protein